MEKLITIVVPIYNVELFLERCIQSLLAQTYKNIEIILVDDGSKDNSSSICDEFAKKDNRIKVIHKENGGLSDARNVGIDAAKGEYITFIDSDDYVSDKYIENMYSKMNEYSLDLVICNYQYVYEDKVVTNDKVVESKVYDKEEIFDEYLYGKNNVQLVVAWNKLYKKELFENLRFTKGIIHEDEDFCYKIFDRCNKVGVIDDELYYYVQRSNSIMATRNPNKEMIVIDIFKNRFNFLLERKYSKKHIRKAFYFYLNSYLQLAKQFKEVGDKENYSNMLKLVSNVYKYKKYQYVGFKLLAKYKVKNLFLRIGLV